MAVDETILRRINNYRMAAADSSEVGSTIGLVTLASPPHFFGQFQDSDLTKNNGA